MRERVTAEAIGRRLGLKRVGQDEWAGPCPVCRGRDRFHARQEGDRLLLGCRKCEAPFEALLDAVSPREHVEPVRRWVWTGPDGEVTQTKPGPKGQKYHVPPRTKRSRYAYRADADAAGPWIITKGAPEDALPAGVLSAEAARHVKGGFVVAVDANQPQPLYTEGNAVCETRLLDGVVGVRPLFSPGPERRPEPVHRRAVRESAIAQALRQGHGL